MRIPYLALMLIVLLNAAVDAYIYCRLRNLAHKVWRNIQLVTAVVFAVGLVALFFVPTRDLSDSALRGLMWIIFFYISVYVPKYIFVVFDLLARVPTLFRGRRIPAVSWTGAVIGAIIFFAMWWGALVNRYNIDVKEVDVPVANLPASFDGFTIAQISDLHVGTYGDNTAFITKLVDNINSLNADVVLFTGDIVNRQTSELEPFVNELSQIRAKYGVYSILGNHDYGDYYHWADESAHRRNNERLAELETKMGWKLLRNEHDYITVGSDTIVIIGVENIGDPPFAVYGNLDKAYPTLNDSLPKILMSHNPAHWMNDIADSESNIALTLSGHTHAMQISVFGWSPASFRYRKWGGMYSDKSGNHLLYVNIGIGTVGFPARIGATPEITLLRLTPKQRND